MKLLLMYCKECQEQVEVKQSSDLPHFCPECRSVDSCESMDSYNERVGEAQADPYPERLWPEVEMN